MRKGIIVKSAALATTLLVTAGCGGKGDKQAQNAVPEETKKTLVRTARAAVRPVEQKRGIHGYHPALHAEQHQPRHGNAHR